MRFDIVIPAHNEEHRIDPTLRALRVGFTDPETRFLVALDACTDDTAAIVRGHAQEDPRVDLYEYPKLGKGGVVLETFRDSDAELVGFVDADGATPPAELHRLVAAARDADGAIASRRHPAAVLPAPRSAGRRLTSLGFAHGVKCLFGLPYGDTQCGAKVFRREAMARLLCEVRSTDLLFDVELLLAARRLGLHVAEVPTIWLDQAGSRVSAMSDSPRMGASLARLWLRHREEPGTAHRVEPRAAPRRELPLEADVAA